MKEKIIKFIRIALSIIIWAYTPIFGIILLMWLSGSDKNNFLIMAWGWCILFIWHVISYKKTWGWYIFIIGIFIFSLWTYLDKIFWNEENTKMCEKLRLNPTCVWSVSGVTCKDEPLGSGFGFSMWGTICHQK